MSKCLSFRNWFSQGDEVGAEIGIMTGDAEIQTGTGDIETLAETGTGGSEARRGETESGAQKRFRGYRHLCQSTCVISRCKRHWTQGNRMSRSLPPGYLLNLNFPLFLSFRTSSKMTVVSWRDSAECRKQARLWCKQLQRKRRLQQQVLLQLVRMWVLLRPVLHFLQHHQECLL